MSSDSLLQPKYLVWTLILRSLQFSSVILFVVVLCAEVISHHFPKLVDLHNYTPASSTKQKEDNWRLLNR